MNANARLTTLTRIGFAARGLLYIVIAVLVLRTGRAEDQSGALGYLREGGGQFLLGVMAAGLAAYGIWRLTDAAFDLERHGSDRRGVFERLGAGASGVVHLFFSWQSVRLMRGVALSGDGTQEGTQTALQMPGGWALVIVGGIILLAVAAVQLMKAVKGSFLRYIDPSIARRPWVQWCGRAGYAARGLVFLISGYFLVRAGMEGQADEAGGMARVLAWLSSPFDVIISAGLLAFGLFTLVEARYRRLHDVPVEQAIRRATSWS